MRDVIKNQILLLCMIFYASCSTVPTTNNELTFYKRDMKVKINNQDFTGVASMGYTKRMKIDAYFKDDADLVRIKTCHRSWDIEDAWKSQSFFKRLSKNSAKIDITLTDLETNEYCPLEIIGFTHSGKHTWFFAVINSGERLLANMQCNGLTQVYSGVSVCQVKAGLVQQIRFSGKTNVRAGENCDIKRISNDLFEFRPKVGYCVARFFNQQKEEHVLTTIGYEEIKLKR